MMEQITMATDIAKIADDDRQIIEGKIQAKIWVELTVQCSIANGTRCALSCPQPCPLARWVIKDIIPILFKNYARWN